MAVIDLMRETSIVEIVGGQEVILEELNHSDTEPIFRQNGYELNGDKKSFALAFDGDSSDNIVLNNQVSGVVTTSDLSFSIDYEVSTFPLSQNTLYSIGRATQEASILLFYNGSGLFILATYDENGLGVDTLILSSFSGKGNITLNNLEVSVNGVNEGTLTDFDISDINSSIYKPKVSGLAYGDFGNLSCTVYGLVIQGIPYNITEGLGNQVYGSDGTIGTINTSHASGIEYTNFGMWLMGDDTNGWFPYVV